MDIGAFGRGKANKAKASTARAKAKGSKDSKDSKDETGVMTGTRTRIRLNVGIVESADTSRKTVGARRTPTKVDATDAHNLDSTKPANLIGVDTGAGKTAWRQSVTYGKKLLGHVDLTFRTATGELVKSGERLYVEGCDDWESIFEFDRCSSAVWKPLLSVGEYTTMSGVTVLYHDKGYKFHKGSNVAKKIEAWIHKEIRDYQYYGGSRRTSENA